MIGLTRTLQKQESTIFNILKVMSPADGSVAVVYDATTQNLRSSDFLRCSCNIDKTWCNFG